MIHMDIEPLAQPNPRPEGLLAHARKLALVARRATDAVNASYLLEKTKTQYTYAIDAFESKGMTSEAKEAREEMGRFLKQLNFISSAGPLLCKVRNFESTSITWPGPNRWDSSTTEQTTLMRS